MLVLLLVKKKSVQKYFMKTFSYTRAKASFSVEFSLRVIRNQNNLMKKKKKKIKTVSASLLLLSFLGSQYILHHPVPKVRLHLLSLLSAFNNLSDTHLVSRTSPI